MTMNAAGWQDDLPGDLLYRLEVAELSRPHIVVTRDLRTGRESFSGPYPTALGALCAAETEYQVDLDNGGSGEITFHAAALYPPLDDGGRVSAASRSACRGDRVLRLPERLTGTMSYAARLVGVCVGRGWGVVRNARRSS